MSKAVGPGFMDFGWGTWAAIIIAVVLVVLFLGPGMWSSSTEFLGTALWRRWRQRRQDAEARRRGEPPRDDEAVR
ncbi:MAG TPA: hypothetical protein VIU64_05100 [Polyangia bacterium]